MTKLTDLLTVKEAAKLVSKHPAAIRRWIKEKRLPARKLSGKYGIFLIRKDDILEMMI